MRISHSQLEICNLDPGAWVRARLAPNFFPGRMGYDGYVKLAIHHFHISGDASAAEIHLDNVINRRELKNVTRIDQAHQQFRSYVRWFNDSATTVGNNWVNISLDLGHGQVLGGRVSRVDVVQDGYRAVLLEHPIPTNWQTHLRMPLIQLAVSNQLQRSLETVAVGVQDINGDSLATVTFDAQAIDGALQRGRAIAAQLAAAGAP